MPNEFVIKNGFISNGNSTVLGSLSATTLSGGTFFGNGSGLTNVQNIYTTNGSLSGNRTLNLSGSVLDIQSTAATTTRFFSNGNVGIGTTNDSGYKLDVNGAIYSRSSVGVSYWFADNTAIRGIGTSNGTLYIDASQDLSGLIRFRSTTLSVDGNISCPSIAAGGLSVNNSNGIIQMSGSGVQSFRIANTNTNTIWSFENHRTGPAGSLEIKNNILTSTPALLLSSGQNVSIGTNVISDFKLDVAGTGRFTSNLTVGGSLSANSFTTSGTYGTTIVNSSNFNGLISLSGSNTVGGTGYTDFIRVTNTASDATNPNKTFRLNNTGDLEVVNSSYSSTIFTLTNAGVLSTPGGGTSDIRTKKNIEYITASTISTLSKLQPVKFEFKNDTGTKRHGFIAQDVLSVEPDLVLGDGDKENGTYGLDYDGILALTVKALQEALTKIEKLENEISIIKNKNI